MPNFSGPIPGIAMLTAACTGHQLAAARVPPPDERLINLSNHREAGRRLPNDSWRDISLLVCVAPC